MFEQRTYEGRELARLTIRKIGWQALEAIDEVSCLSLPCLHADLSLADPNIDLAVEYLNEAGFVFAGMLPGYLGEYVLRLQKWQRSCTDETPRFVNLEAIQVHRRIMSELI